MSKWKWLPLTACIGFLVAADRKPQDIVNIVLSDHAGGDTRTLYTVPAQRWLIITDVEGDGGSSATIELTEASGAGTVAKLHTEGAPARWHSTTGAAFAPGSKVIINDRGWNSASVTGYLAEP